VQPPVDEKGAHVEGRWVDEPRLEIADATPTPMYVPDTPPEGPGGASEARAVPTTEGGPGRGRLERRGPASDTAPGSHEGDPPPVPAPGPRAICPTCRRLLPMPNLGGRGIHI